jgi:hypothetical protein
MFVPGSNDAKFVQALSKVSYRAKARRHEASADHPLRGATGFALQQVIYKVPSEAGGEASVNVVRC